MKSKTSWQFLPFSTNQKFIAKKRQFLRRMRRSFNIHKNHRGLKFFFFFFICKHLHFTSKDNRQKNCLFYSSKITLPDYCSKTVSHMLPPESTYTPGIMLPQTTSQAAEVPHKLSLNCNVRPYKGIYFHMFFLVYGEMATIIKLILY